MPGKEKQKSEKEYLYCRKSRTMHIFYQQHFLSVFIYLFLLFLILSNDIFVWMGTSTK